MAFTVEPGIYVARDKASVELSEASYDPDEALRMAVIHGPARAKQAAAEAAETAGTRSFDVPEEFLGIGVRIEDDILITESGYENLTELVPVSPDAVEALCAEESSLPVFG